MSWNVEESIYNSTVTLLLHIYGIATAIALWVIAIYVTKFPETWSSFQGYQWYMILATAAVSLLELIFILAFCPLCWCCLCCKFIDGWMRACLYAAFTIPIFVFSADSTLACLWAALLLILAFLHLVKSIHQLCHTSSDHPKNPSTEGHKKAPNGGAKDDAVNAQPAANYGATNQP